MNLAKLEKKIGYFFKDKELLKKALTHRSYANENNIESNEKLEFLGDSILEFISSKYLFENYKNLKEGEMTKVRAAVVCEESLYKIAYKHNFSDFLYLGKSELKNSCIARKAILADSVEAIIAAMYLDSDIETAEKFIIENLKEPIEFASKNVGMKDYKTVLQEKLQREDGPDHDKVFTIKVYYNGQALAEGIGKTKKSAQMEAARRALEKLK